MRTGFDTGAGNPMILALEWAGGMDDEIDVEGAQGSDEIRSEDIPLPELRPQLCRQGSDLDRAPGKHEVNLLLPRQAATDDGTEVSVSTDHHHAQIYRHPSHPLSNHGLVIDLTGDAQGQHRTTRGLMQRSLQLAERRRRACLDHSARLSSRQEKREPLGSLIQVRRCPLVFVVGRQRHRLSVRPTKRWEVNRLLWSLEGAPK